MQQIIFRKLKLKTDHNKSTTSKACTNQTGFTLIELMITIVIAGIIMGVGLPNLGSFLAQMRVDNQVTQLQRLLLITRNAAINSGETATICPLNADKTACAGTSDWHKTIGVISSNGLIKEREPIKSGDKLESTLTSVVYSSTGQSVGVNANVDFSYCPNGYDEFSRGVTVTISGRPYLSTDISGDGIDQDRDGDDIACP